ncbi:hypothetical protein F5B20DRAFT_520574 [Whalleya microplaca]|nr:hypothetical protein F5B20DRAFT_520574 [Whalleya microplaca]
MAVCSNKKYTLCIFIPSLTCLSTGVAFLCVRIPTLPDSHRWFVCFYCMQAWQVNVYVRNVYVHGRCKRFPTYLRYISHHICFRCRP